MANQDRFIEGLAQFDIVCTDIQLKQFQQYYEILTKWNQVMNLTAITEYEEVVTKHFLDSVSLVKILPDLLDQQKNHGKKLLDLGTGAGFPGIPLKIIFPDISITLMDSLNKRIQFLQEVILSLGLKEIVAVHARAEEVAKLSLIHIQFDLCVSRAVARLNSLAELCLPFVKKGGFFIPYKAAKISEELQEASFAISQLGGEVKKSKTFLLPNSDMERSLVLIEKVKMTSSFYPRGGGKPLKAPLQNK